MDFLRIVHQMRIQLIILKKMLTALPHNRIIFAAFNELLTNVVIMQRSGSSVG